jgi:hypothetical protein
MKPGQRLALDGALVLSVLVILVSWFTTALLKPRATVILALLTIAVLTASRWREIRVSRPRTSTVLVCGLGLLLRAPAFVESAGFVGADGSLQAMLVNVVLSGPLPAPVFIEGSSYQGSLKAHLGALASGVLGRDDLGLLVVVGSVALWTMFTASTMSLGRRLGGEVPAVVAGLFVALSPRFVTIFSVSNVGEYPDALGLGMWAMAWSARLLANGDRGAEARGGFLGIGMLLGLALWQQPIAASFAAVALGVLALRAIRERDAWFLASILGLALGRLPVTIHDLQAVSSNQEVVGSFMRSAAQSLPFREHLRGTLEWAFPIVFAGLSNDSTEDAEGRITIGLACSALLVAFLWRAVVELRSALRDRSWDVVRVMAAAQFLAALAFVWLVAGGGQYTRPRYFLPLLAGFALAFGDVTGALWSRSRLAAIALAVLVIGSNALSNAERLEAGLRDGRRLRQLATKIEQLGLKTGYSEVGIAGPLTMLTGERVSVDGVLASAVGQRLPARHIDRVLRDGPDFYLAEPTAAEHLTRRFEELGVTYRVEGESPRLFYQLSRRVPLSEAQGR